MSVEVAAYARVSTMEQADKGVSLDAQQAAISAYCQMRSLNLTRVFVDRGVSASIPLAKRPEGAKLVEGVASGQFKGVVAIKLDRLFRDVSDCLVTLKTWDALDARVHLVDQGGVSIDTRSAMGRFLLTLVAAVAEMERNLIRERIQASLDHKRENGERISGHLPYGQQLHVNRKLLEPNPEEQRIIAYIHKLHRDGLSIRKIAARLNTENVTARGQRWHTSSVHRVLQIPPGTTDERQNPSR